MDVFASEGPIAKYTTRQRISAQHAAGLGKIPDERADEIMGAGKRGQSVIIMGILNVGVGAVIRYRRGGFGKCVCSTKGQALSEAAAKFNLQ